ncbi:MAG: VCBS repeat-containing protein [Cyclobacteriaceae bacterium]|nr:VCBS repeat-containing protein [Cyclobacteriaceae bacterium]
MRSRTNLQLSLMMVVFCLSGVSSLAQPIITNFTPASVTPDGCQDFVTTCPFSAQLRIFLGNGNVTFTNGQIINSGFSVYVATEDFNGDGNLDLVEAYNNGANVSLDDGTGNFIIVTGLPVTDAACIAASGYNGDGRPDIATCNYFNPEMSFRKTF